MLDEECSKNRHSSIFRKLWIFHNFRWFFRKFSSPLLCLIIDSPPGFRGYFAFFSMRKKAINIILNDLESSQRGLQSLVMIIIFLFWVIWVFILSYRHLDVFLRDLIIFKYFAFFMDCGNFPFWSHIAVNKLNSWPNFRQGKSGAESVLINFIVFTFLPDCGNFSSFLLTHTLI